MGKHNSGENGADEDSSKERAKSKAAKGEAKDRGSSKSSKGKWTDISFLNTKGVHQLKDMPKQDDPIWWKHLFIMVGIVVLLAVVPFLNTINSPLVFNDFVTMSFIPSLSDKAQFWSQLWSHAWQAPLTQPWLKATYAWDVINSQTSKGYSLPWLHIANIGYHAMASVYLFFFVFIFGSVLKKQGRLAVSPYKLAFASAALYACHPLNSEGVAYISGRTGPLLACNYFLALNSFLLFFVGKSTAQKIWGAIITVSVLIMALMVSPQALTLPFVMVAVALLLKPNSLTWSKYLYSKGIVIGMIILIGMLLPLLVGLGLPVLPTNGAGLPVPDPFIYWASQFKAILTYYLRCSFLPIGLCLDPPKVIANGFGDPLSIAGIILVLVCFAMMWRLRKSPVLVFGMFLFLLGFLPLALLVQPEVVADRRMNISLAGFTMLLGYAITLLTMLNVGRYFIILGVICLGFSGITFWRNMSWSSHYAFWQSALEGNSRSARVQAMMALSCVKDNKPDDAKVHVDIALKLNPQIPQGHLALAAIYFAKRDFKRSATEFETAYTCAVSQEQPAALIATCLTGLAESLMEQGQYPKAIMLSQQALVTEPAMARARYVIGRSLYMQKNYKQAFAQLQMALSEDDSITEAWKVLAQTALALKVPDASYYATQVLVTRDKSVENLIMATQAALLNGQIQTAKEDLDQALQLDSSSMEGNALMSLVQEQLGNKEKAEHYRKLALVIDPQAFEKVTMMKPASKP